MNNWEMLEKMKSDIEQSDLSEDQKLVEIDKAIGIAHERTIYERMTERRKSVKKVGNYNISYLDDYLSGIMPGDFILIGADTGCGKSELAYKLAFSNAEEGKRVHLIALECDEDEPYSRNIYKQIAKKYYREGNRYSGKLTYRNYMLSENVDSEEIDQLEREAIAETTGKAKTLHIHYRGKEFGIKDLIEKFTYIAGRCDLLVIDHIDYFDLNISENENAQVTNIMKVLRDLNHSHNIPIIVISHMRKKQNRKQKLPGIEDFMGTSNKAKQVKTIIILARDYERDKYDEYKYGTFIYAAKAGRFAPSTNLVARTIYDGLRNEYEDRYELGRICNYGEEVGIELSRPDWARRAAQNLDEKKEVNEWVRRTTGGDE